MCEICDKVDFAIETIESLFPTHELVALYRRSGTDETKASMDSLKQSVNENSARANFIAMLAARYAIKSKFHPHVFSEVLLSVLASEYSHDTLLTLMERLTGTRPSRHDLDYKEKENGYES